MCGIVGILAAPSKERTGMFEDMLIMDAVRGQDSTGVAFINKKSVDVIKDAVLPGDLMAGKEYEEAAKRHRFCLIGHNRAATIGWVTKRNAHPFKVGDITLVHNGTLSSTWRMPSDLMFDTDSECIANSIAEYGIELTWPVLDGAATLVFWDNADQTLNIISNNKRPFHFHPLEDNQGLVWSSEPWTYRVAAARNGVKLEDPGAIHVPEPDTLYSISFSHKQNKFTYKKKKLPAFADDNRIPGLKVFPPAYKKASESAAAFEEWKNKYVDPWGYGACFPGEDAIEPQTFDKKDDSNVVQLPLPVNSNADEEDKRLRAKYPEAFENEGESLDTRATPFRGATKHIASGRTAKDFEAFDLEEMNKKFCTVEWFLENYRHCMDCEGPLTREDFKTARILDDHSALCEHCQRDVYITSGIEPDQIKKQ